MLSNGSVKPIAFLWTRATTIIIQRQLLTISRHLPWWIGTVIRRYCIGFGRLGLSFGIWRLEVMHLLIEHLAHFQLVHIYRLSCCAYFWHFNLFYRLDIWKSRKSSMAAWSKLIQQQKKYKEIRQNFAKTIENCMKTSNKLTHEHETHTLNEVRDLFPFSWFYYILLYEWLPWKVMTGHRLTTYPFWWWT